MNAPTRLVADYGTQIAQLSGSASTTEATFYPAIQALLSGVLHESKLPFEVRTNTSQQRAARGTDLPDLAFFDGASDAVVVLGEVKALRVELEDFARSTERRDQIGRYLAQTGVVLLTNVRAFGLLVIDPAFQGDGPVPPAHRRLLEVVELWPSASAVAQGRPPLTGAAAGLAELLETAVTEFAPIARPESLARILARLARRAKDSLPAKFSQAVQPLLEDFAKALGIHFEGEEGEEFLRSSLIQTAFYGVFAAWTLWRHSGEPRRFRWEDLGDYLKIPFLGELFHEFRHPQRLRELGLAHHLERATAALSRVDTDRFFARFAVADLRVGRDTSSSSATSAILYFYEPFLEAFDPVLRKKLGVWYTPQEIVRYQVRKVERLLREELGCDRGFADDRVVVLDPCCGTGAYLIEVLRCIAEQLEVEGSGALLGRKLLDALCRRVVGFEILTAPFVIAQLQVYLILSSLGTEPDASHRPAIFLTNALTGWEGLEQLRLQFPELQQEHDAARRIKREAKIIVILGNPPYDRFAGVPIEEEADLVDHYKGIRRNSKGKQLGNSELYARFGVRKNLLNELYVRFFRLAEVRIGERAEQGVVSWISNYSFLAGRSHPLMRESLLHSFDSIWIDNLNGDKYRTGKAIPQGLPGEESADQSVFTTEQDARGIQVGTAITTLLKRKSPREKKSQAQIYFRDFWGRSLAKRQALVESLDFGDLAVRERRRLAALPHGPRDYESVVPTALNRWRMVPTSFSGGYEDWPALDELFPVRFQGVNPNRGLEGSVIDTDPEALAARMRDYFSDLTLEELCRLYPVLLQPRARYEAGEVRRQLRRLSWYRPERIVPYLLFPLDPRFVYYETEAKLLNERRPELWDNLTENVFLVTVPEPRRVSESRPLVATSLFDLHLHDRGSVGFPLHVRRTNGPRDLFSDDSDDTGPRANLRPALWPLFKRAWKLRGDLDGPDAHQFVGQLFHVALALGHSPAFEGDHRNALSQDWLHLPIPKRRSLFAGIAELGATLGILLDPLADSAKPLKELLGPRRRTLGAVTSRGREMIGEADLLVSVSFYGSAHGGWEERSPAAGEATDAAWGESTGDLRLNDTTYLKNVPERVWRFELGGYPVIKKWLGYRDSRRRPGLGLTLAELDHLRAIVHRLAAVLLLHRQLDVAYEQAIADPFTSEDLGLLG